MDHSVAEGTAQLPVKIGLIGLGFAGTGLHLPTLSKNARAEIVAVSDVLAERLTEFKANYPTLKAETHKDYDAIIQNKQIEAVFIASPTPSHAEIAIKALKAGKHVFCEKPISSNLDDAERMVAEGESRSGQQVLMIGQVLRFWPEYVESKKLIDQGKIGKPVIARTRRAVAMPQSKFYEKDELSGGVIVDLGLHDIDFLTWALGPVATIFGQGRNISGRGDIIDYAQLHFNFKSGPIGYLEANWAVPDTYPFTCGFEITGTSGMVAWDNNDMQSSFHLTVKGQLGAGSVPSDSNGYHNEQEAFLKAIQTKSPTPMAARDAMYSLRLAFAAKEAIRTGKEIDPAHFQVEKMATVS